MTSVVMPSSSVRRRAITRGDAAPKAAQAHAAPTNAPTLQECNITRKYAYTVLITGALKHDTVLHIRVLCISSAATQYFNAVPHLMSYDCGEYVNFSSSFFDCAAAAAALPGE